MYNATANLLQKSVLEMHICIFEYEICWRVWSYLEG